MRKWFVLGLRELSSERHALNFYKMAQCRGTLVGAKKLIPNSRGKYVIIFA